MSVYTGYKGTPLQRFWSKITIREDGCWFWTGYCDDDGYGRFRAVKGESMVLAHRWAFELFVGPIPDGCEIDHTCRTRPCVRPDHLDPVGHDVNMLRARRTHCKNGHPLEGDNVYESTDSRGYLNRRCRACARERQHRYAMRKKV